MAAELAGLLSVRVRNNSAAAACISLLLSLSRSWISTGTAPARCNRCLRCILGFMPLATLQSTANAAACPILRLVLRRYCTSTGMVPAAAMAALLSGEARPDKIITAISRKYALLWLLVRCCSSTGRPPASMMAELSAALVYERPASSLAASTALTPALLRRRRTSTGMLVVAIGGFREPSKLMIKALRRRWAGGAASKAAAGGHQPPAEVAAPSPGVHLCHKRALSVVPRPARAMATSRWPARPHCPQAPDA